MKKDNKNYNKKVKKRKNKINSFLIDNLDYELRPIQKLALNWIKEQVNSGKKYLFLDLPTGSGKSILANYAALFYLNEINNNAKFDIITNTKMLQNQYLKDFEYMSNLWGRSNYKCEQWGESCDHGNECNKNNKTKCEECPYEEAKSEWLDSKIGLTNFHILGLYSLFNSEILELRQSKVLIIDEAHLFEETINGFVTFILSKKVWRNLIVDNLDNEYEMVLARLENVDDIAKWIENTLIVDLEKSELKHRWQLTTVKEMKKWQEKVRNIKNIGELLSKLNKFLEDYKGKVSDWVTDRKIIKGDITWTIQPLWTGDILSQNVWKNYDLVIFMSGSIIDCNTFAYLNGIPSEEFSYLQQPSPFDVEKRPIYYYPLGKLSFYNKEASWDKFVPVIKQILKKYKGKKGIIHTNSYEFLQYIQRDIQDKRLLFVESDKREMVLKEHINCTEDTVLVSASMTEGVDLKDDLSRFQIIIKVPYPNLSSKVNQTRLKIKPSWYNLKTIQTLVQSYGRSIRNEEDYCDTFILDSCFGELLASQSSYFPQFFLNAIKKINTKR